MNMNISINSSNTNINTNTNLILNTNMNMNIDICTTNLLFLDRRHYKLYIFIRRFSVDPTTSHMSIADSQRPNAGTNRLNLKVGLTQTAGN